MVLDETKSVVSMQRPLRRLVWSFVYIYPELDFTEVLSECQPKLVTTVRSFRPGKAQLITYVWHCLRNYLIAKVRSRKWRSRMSRKAGGYLKDVHATNGKASVVETLLLESSENAADAVRLGLGIDDGIPMSHQSLIESLTCGMGWDMAEVARVFREIRESL